MGESEIKQFVTKDGSSGFKAESGRYHLYIAYGCPFAHRVNFVRILKGLENAISLDIVDYIFVEQNGWKFSPEKEGCTVDTANGKTSLKEVYLMSHPNYTGRITVPVLFDKKTKTIVNNDSSDLMKMLNREFNEFSATEEQAKIDLYPEQHIKEIDELASWVVPAICFGVYHCSSNDQKVYEAAVTSVFNALDKIEVILSKDKYLAGSTMTGVDVMLFVALYRFDSVYFSLFKCNKRMLTTYPNIWPYVRDIYQMDHGSCNMDHVKKLYWNNATRNPSLIIPIGPDIDFTEPSGCQ